MGQTDGRTALSQNAYRQQVRVQLPVNVTYCSHLLSNPVLLCARRPSLSTDISCLPGRQQQTRRTLLQRSIDGTDRRAERRTSYRYIDPAANYVSNVNVQLRILQNRINRHGFCATLQTESQKLLNCCHKYLFWGS